jgi:hypothetical protein
MKKLLMFVVLCAMIGSVSAAPVNLCGGSLLIAASENPPACNALSFSPPVGDSAEWAKTVVAPVNSTGLDGHFGVASDPLLSFFVTFAGVAFQQQQVFIAPGADFRINFSPDVLAMVGAGLPFNIDFFAFNGGGIVVVLGNDLAAVGELFLDNVEFTTPKVGRIPAPGVAALFGLSLIGFALSRRRV